MKSKTFRHSGKLGDIIYSLPTVKALGGGTFYVDYRTEYLGKPPLGKETALMTVKLLETQDYIEKASLYEEEPISYNLDEFRNKAVPIHFFNLIKNESDEISGALFGPLVKEIRKQIFPTSEVDLPQLIWESAGLAGEVDLSSPWITGIPQKRIADIVVSKTIRYPGKLDWPRLKEYASRSIFVGLEEEWRAFCKAYFEIEFYRAEDLLDLAEVIAGAKLFVGNQSFALALADAMLIPRVAQLWEPSPNRISPVNSHRALTQDIIRTYVSV